MTLFGFLGWLFWAVVQPLNLVVLLIVAAALLHWRGLHVLSRRLVVTGSALLALLALLPVGQALLLPLENAYARPAALPAGTAGIIFLGGATEMPVTRARGRTELSPSGDRILATAELARAHPALPVVLSGGAAGPTSEAAHVRDTLVALGIDPSRLILEEQSRSTLGNAWETRARVSPVAGQPWVLVTSAWHMPRAVHTFEAAGFEVVPWPVDHRTDGGLRLFPFDALTRMEEATIAIKEWIGLAAYWAIGYSDRDVSPPVTTEGSAPPPP